MTITRIGSAPSEFDHFPVVRVRTRNEAENRGLQAFRPFSLAGSYQELVDAYVTVRMRGCFEEGTSVTLGDAPVTYRVLGITHHATVYPLASLEVVGAHGVHCT